MHSILVGLDGIKVTLDLKDGVTEVPIGQEIGIRLEFLENPGSTKPSDPFQVVVRDIDENLIVEITKEAELLKDFVMHATSPAELIFGLVDNEPKQALEPALIKMQLMTRHELPKHAKLQITVPDQLGLAEDTEDGAKEFKCWIDSSPFGGNVECTFDRVTRTYTLIDINPHGSVRGGSTLKIELEGLYNRDIAETTDSFTALTLTEDGYLID